MLPGISFGVRTNRFDSMHPAGSKVTLSFSYTPASARRLINSFHSVALSATSTASKPDLTRPQTNGKESASLRPLDANRPTLPPSRSQTNAKISCLITCIATIGTGLMPALPRMQPSADSLDKGQRLDASQLERHGDSGVQACRIQIFRFSSWGPAPLACFWQTSARGAA